MNMFTSTPQKTQVHRRSLPAMAATYCFGVFNDNYFKQAAMLLAVAGGLNQLQGWAAMLFALPFILFSAHGGWCADRFPKKIVVVLAKILELAAMLVGAAGLVAGSWPCILAMVFLMGLQSTFFSPALNGSIPELYPTDSVPRINAILKLATTLAILAGIATAGISLDQNWFDTGTLPFGVALVAAIAVGVAAIGAAASFGIEGSPANTQPNTKPFPWFGPLNSIRDLMDIGKDRQLLIAIIADAYFYCIASITVLVINALGIQQFGFSQTMTSLLSVSLMLGVCAGSFLAARLIKVANWSVYLVRSAFGICVGLLLAGITVMVPAPFQFLWLASALAAAGMAGGLFLIPVTSIIQVRPANFEKGRVLAAAGFSSFSAILISGMLYTLLEPYLQPATYMTVLGLFALAVTLIFSLILSTITASTKTWTGRILRMLLSLRYDIQVSGLEQIEPKGKTGILFLPNHPALIDPVIIMSALHDRFAPRPLSDIDQVNKPVVRQIMRPLRPITLPNVGKNGRSSKEAVHTAINEVIESLKQGENILLYPAGRLNLSTQENLAGNSGVEYIIRHVPEVQIVLARTTGLWGSSFSRATGKAPTLTRHLKTYLKALICNCLFFSPKRKVSLEFREDLQVQQLQERSQINRYLESFYNATTVVNTHVPYYWWQGRQAEQRLEVSVGQGQW